MAKQILNDLETYGLIRNKINDNFTDLYTNKSDSTHTHEQLHSHNNKAQVDKIGEDVDGKFTYNGLPIEGGSGVSDYEDLSNKPTINNIELTGNKTLADLGIQPVGDYLTEVPSEYVTDTELDSKGYATTSQIPDVSNKLEISNILQGTNIILNKVGNDITINSTGEGGSGGSIVTDSEINGNIVIDGSEVNVYTPPSDVAKTSDLHSHNNKTTLDEITTVKTTEWDTVTNKLDKTGDTKDNIATFTEAEIDEDIATNETHSNMFGKILKSIKTLRSGKIDKTSIVNTDTINDTTKVPSTAVTYALGQEVDTLTNNLGDIDSQLASTVRIQNDYSITQINAAIAESPSNSTIEFADGTYDITSLVLKSNITLRTGKAILKYKAGESGIFIDLAGLDNIRIDGFTIDGQDTTTYVASSADNGTRIGINISGDCSNVEILNCNIAGFLKAGVYASDVGYITKHKGPSIINTHIDNCYYGYVFDTRAEYAKVTGSTAINCRYGVKVVGGSNHFSNCGFDDNVDGVYLGGGANNSHGGFHGCTINHNSQYGIMSDGVTFGETFNGCHIYGNDIFIKNSIGIQIINGHLGNPINIYLQGSKGMIKDNMIVTSVTINRGFGSSPDEFEIKGNRFMDGTTNANTDCIDYFADLRGLTVATGITAETTVVFGATGATRKKYNQVDATLYNTTTGVGTIPITRKYAIKVMLKLANPNASVCNTYVYIRKTLGSNAMVDYKTISIPASATNFVVSLSGVGLIDAGSTYEVRVGSNTGINLVSSESRLLVESIN